MENLILFFLHLNKTFNPGNNLITYKNEGMKNLFLFFLYRINLYSTRKLFNHLKIMREWIILFYFSYTLITLISPHNIRPDQVRPNLTKSSQNLPDQINYHKARPGQTRSDQVKAELARSDQSASGQTKLNQFICDGNRSQLIFNLILFS